MDKEKVIKGVHDARRYLEDREWVDKSVGVHIDALNDALALLKEQEAVNKNTGEWKNGHCSCCGEDISSMLDTWTNVQNFLFCPNCGAKMEGGEVE